MPQPEADVAAWSQDAASLSIDQPAIEQDAIAQAVIAQRAFEL